MARLKLLFAVLLGIGFSPLGNSARCETPTARVETESAIQEFQELIATGKLAQAERLAEETLKKHPQSPSAQLLRQYSGLVSKSLTASQDPSVPKKLRLEDKIVVTQLHVVDVPETLIESLIGTEFDPPLEKSLRADAKDAKPEGIELVFPKSPYRLPPPVLTPLETTLLQHLFQLGDCPLISRSQVGALPNQWATVQLGESANEPWTHKFRVNPTKDGEQLQVELHGRERQTLVEGRLSRSKTVVKWTIPIGQTLLVDLGPHIVEHRSEQGVPVLDKVPYTSRLFKNVGVARESCKRMVLITPKLVKPPSPEEINKGSVPQPLRKADEN